MHIDNDVLRNFIFKTVYSGTSLKQKGRIDNKTLFNITR